MQRLLLLCFAWWGRTGGSVNMSSSSALQAPFGWTRGTLQMFNRMLGKKRRFRLRSKRERRPSAPPPPGTKSTGNLRHQPHGGSLPPRGPLRPFALFSGGGQSMDFRARAGAVGGNSLPTLNVQNQGSRSSISIHFPTGPKIANIFCCAWFTGQLGSGKRP